MCVNPKYNIKRLLLALPGSFTQNKYRLAIELNISERTIDKWCETEKGQRYSMPSDHLLNMAKFFNCNITDLING